ncbi:hypothetical protein JHK86_006279 [Glycine max]|nr:hypothetical protein JHK86_006279 [Glycine max]
MKNRTQREGEWRIQARSCIMVLDVIGQSHHALSFARFACRHGKRYHSVDEIRNGFQIFSDNLKLIRSTNRRSLTYTLGVNHFADWTWEEFTRHKLGAPQNWSATLKGNHRLTDAVLLDEVVLPTLSVTASFRVINELQSSTE